MTQAHESDHLQPYRDAMAAHGPGFDATLWRDQAAQQLRFEVATGMLPCEGLRVADLGCGVGDLAAWLAGSAAPPAAYLGIDAQDDMVDEARAQQASVRAFETMFALEDITMDLARAADWSPDVCILSGTLNTMPQDMALDVVSRAFDVANVGVVFNFLSDRPAARYQGRDTSPARRFETTTVLQWCLERTPLVRFRQDYLDGHDATIAMMHVGP